ncbi:MAG TPA: IS1634 family transposase [Verrucomicrobiae bacterium]|nr:IS1634 family transposase [Verrucomicrobiae bacterium]
MSLFLRGHERRKDGKTNTYWSLVENRRCAGGRVVQRHVLYLGRLTPAQEASWQRTAQVFGDVAPAGPSLPGLAGERELQSKEAAAIAVHLKQFRIERPRQWGACWVALRAWNLLKLSEFWSSRLPPSREGTRWLNVLITLVVYRLIDPGSEWRLHRQWYSQSAIGDLLGEDFGLAAKDNLYRCLDRLLEHREELFKYLRGRWQDEFGAKFDVLLYDLTSTYFESDPPFPQGDKRRFGYSRDKRPDCVQVVIALVVTPEGYPLAYEVLSGNTSDKTTLRQFLEKIEKLYGKANRVWVMDRGIPTEEVILEMQQADPQIGYLVGTPKGRLTRLEAQLLELPWQQARPSVRVKLLPKDKELYVFVESQDRLKKERAMRLSKLRALIKRLRQLQNTKKPLTRDQLLMAVGQAKEQAGRAFKLLDIQWPQEGQEVNAQTFTFRLALDRYRLWYRREGRYLLRTNLTQTDPKQLWEYYLQLVAIEAAFRNLKEDLEIRPVFHQKEERIEAHIFVAYLAYCLHVTLQAKLRQVAGGLTPRSLLEKFSTMQMMDVFFPTEEPGKELVFRRYTQPEKDHQILLAQLGWELPGQPPPRISVKGQLLD